jgi:hypothetical protein
MDEIRKNELKKLLYKNNPIAFFNKIRLGVAYYQTFIDDSVISFEVPINDMGEADFEVQMKAKYLVRWMI